jgi:hypothetical protein
MGVSFFDPSADMCVWNVFDWADAKMYIDNQAMKAARA